MNGGGTEKADLWHVLCGECEGMDSETKGTHRKCINESLQKVYKKLTQKEWKGKGKARKEVAHHITHGRKEVLEVVTNAQRCLAKRTTATREEREGMRRWLAGDLPRTGVERSSNTQNAPRKA